MPQPVMLKSTFYCFPSLFSQFKTSCRVFSQFKTSCTATPSLDSPNTHSLWLNILNLQLTLIWIWNQVSKIKTCFWKSIHFIIRDIWLKIYCNNLILIPSGFKQIWCQLHISCSEPYLYHIKTCRSKSI
jgi:hypothetical protein